MRYYSAATCLAHVQPPARPDRRSGGRPPERDPWRARLHAAEAGLALIGALSVVALIAAPAALVAIATLGLVIAAFASSRRLAPPHRH